MKPAKLDIVSRDLGLAPTLSNMAKRLETLERRLGAVDGLPAGAPLASGRAADAVTLERQRVRDRAIDEVYFKMEIEPGVGATFAGITLDTATYSFTVMDMPAGAVSAYRRSKRVRGLWPRTTAKLELWFTSPVGNTANFSMTFLGRMSGAGFVLGSPGTAFSAPFTMPGPAVANTIQKVTYRTTGAFPSSPELFALTLARLAPDANPNALRIIYGEMTLEESA